MTLQKIRKDSKISSIKFFDNLYVVGIKTPGSLEFIESYTQFEFNNLVIYKFDKIKYPQYLVNVNFDQLCYIIDNHLDNISRNLLSALAKEYVNGGCSECEEVLLRLQELL